MRAPKYTIHKERKRCAYPIWERGNVPYRGAISAWGESDNMKIRLPRQRDNEAQPEYLNNSRERTWVDDNRARGGAARFRRTFIRIIGLMIALLVIIIMAIVSSTTGGNAQVSNQITAAETYAVSSDTQNQMRATTEDFIYGMLLLSYCNDEQVAQEGKDRALATMAVGSQSYELVEAMTPGEGSISPDDLEVVIGGLSMSSGTRAYAGSYSWEGRGGVADKSQTDDEHPDGTLVDKGYAFSVSFSQVTDENGDNPSWKISYARISRA